MTAGCTVRVRDLLAAQLGLGIGRSLYSRISPLLKTLNATPWDPYVRDVYGLGLFLWPEKVALSSEFIRESIMTVIKQIKKRIISKIKNASAPWHFVFSCSREMILAWHVFTSSTRGAIGSHFSARVHFCLTIAALISPGRLAEAVCCPKLYTSIYNLIYHTDIYKVIYWGIKLGAQRKSQIFRAIVWL